MFRFVQEVVFFLSLVVFLHLLVDFLQLFLAFFNEQIFIEFVLGLVEKRASLLYLFLFNNIGYWDASVSLHSIKDFLELLYVFVQLW